MKFFTHTPAFLAFTAVRTGVSSRLAGSSTLHSSHRNREQGVDGQSLPAVLLESSGISMFGWSIGARPRHRCHHIGVRWIKFAATQRALTTIRIPQVVVWRAGVAAWRHHCRQSFTERGDGIQWRCARLAVDSAACVMRVRHIGSTALPVGVWRNEQRHCLASHDHHFFTGCHFDFGCLPGFQSLS